MIPLKNILLIGVGGTGSAAVDILYRKIEELGNRSGNRIRAIVFDTDEGSVAEIKSADAVSMADPTSVGAICDRIGTDYLREWFPCDTPTVRSQEMVRGASQWRKKSFLAFLNVMNKQGPRATFHRALEGLVDDPGVTGEIYVISSIAGGTGSGAFIPIALYARRYLKRYFNTVPDVSAMVALPDIYADRQTGDNKVKIFANAYAILRELNAINQVATGYNDARRHDKRAPIRFRLGHPDEPTVGLLFDAADTRFWTPDAAPFQRVFLLDRIPGVTSIRAHDIVLADSLYAILCTGMGVEFAKEHSNYEMLRNQRNGSNAMYAGISTSQLRFPKTSVLDYLAHEKTLATCEAEWLVLHRATEDRITENELRDKEMHRRYALHDGDYAKLLLEQLSYQESDTVRDLVDRGTALYAENGTQSAETTADVYFKLLSTAIEEKIVRDSEMPYARVLATMSEVEPVKRPGLFGGKDAKARIAAMAEELEEMLSSYFARCVEVIRTSATLLVEAILTFDEKKDVCANPRLSLVANTLMQKKQYIHPVGAMVQLCRLKRLMFSFLEKGDKTEWEALKSKDIPRVPMTFFPVEEQNDLEFSIRPRASAYRKLEGDRFEAVLNKKPVYMDARTDVYTDSVHLRADALAALERIRREAVHQLMRNVYTRVSARVDQLIAKYRAFFARFERAKEDLVESTKNALRRDAGRQDSVLNIFSDEESKLSVLREVTFNAGPDTVEGLAASDHAAGESVFATVYRNAVGEVNGTLSFRTETTDGLRDLFSHMIASYRKSIGASTAFAPYENCTLLEAIEYSCGRYADRRTMENAIRQAFMRAQELSKPTLLVDTRRGLGGTPTPGMVTVVMMSRGMAKYIKKRADAYELNLPSDQSNEEEIERSCAEQFIHRYSGNEGVRLVIVDGIPDYVVYFTGEMLNITPLRIAKFDEMNAEHAYFHSYSEAVKNSRLFDTDMWNPHLGYHLHKRGNLPYMNEEMETFCDDRMIRALLYAFVTDKITLRTGGKLSAPAFRFTKMGVEQVIFGMNGQPVGMKNLSQLFAWLRNEDEMVDEWCREFDRWFDKQKKALPAGGSEAEVTILLGQLTGSPFMKMLTGELYTDEKKNRRGLIEFAYAVKTDEEADRDCDDAERVLRVAYRLFVELCEHRADRYTNTETFREIYVHELKKVFEGFAGSYSMRRSEIPRAYFDRVASWLNSAGTFLDIPETDMLDADGSIRIDKFYTPDSDVMAAIRAAGRKPAAPEPAAATEAPTAEAETEIAEPAAATDEPAPKKPTARRKKAEPTPTADAE